MSSNPSDETYPGNPALPREVREKILSTFRHTLNLYNQGKTDDCVIGCDFILKMDPRFAPARKLMDKAKNPAAAVDVAELEALVTSTPTRQERVAAVDPDRLLVRAVESYNARDFDATISAAEQVLAVLPGNRDALEILEKAAGKKAAQPLFEASRQRAIAALEGKNPKAATQELERMRGLDPDHPAVALLERRLGGPAPAAPPPPRPVDDPAAAFSEDFHFDLSTPEAPHFDGLGSETREPEIHFNDNATVSLKPGAPPPSPAPHADSNLDSLSLDSLSLDPVAAVPPAPEAADMDATNPKALRTPLPPQPQPGSPADLWGGAPEGSSFEESHPQPEPPSAPVLAPPPAPAPTPTLAPIEDDDAGANEREIQALLHQGDEMVRRGDRQQAIEIWSRIFLIDINNTDAVNRIEKGRQEMAEGNRTISDSLKAGREKFEAGDFSGAREFFLQVLAIDENEPTARFYMDRIEEELARGPSTPESASAPFSAAESAASHAGAAAPAAGPAAAPKGLPIPPQVLAMVAIALVAIAAGVYFFVLRTSKPQPHGPAASTAATAPASLAHAKELADAGKTEDARKELLRLPRSSADYAQARKMLAGLASAPAAQTASGPAVGVLPTTPVASDQPVPTPGPNDPAVLRAAGERALAEKRYIEALKNFNLASAAFRNDPTFAQSLGVASDKVTVLAPAVKLYNEGEYETAIPILWRIYQEDRENQDAKFYLLRSYYNEGISQLQNGVFDKAMRSFDEALALDPNDADIIRNRKFAEHYQKGDLDLMGRIYVRHLNRRP